MKLSVIIVNYNVQAYLEQCLLSVRAAMHGVDGDVYVVDNTSSDGSVAMVQERFPEVKLIANAENVGFSRANNQAIRLSNAEYVVLLNPDTVVGEDLFRRVVAFMDARPKAGGLGVRMVDGAGNFLPESKRGLPTPAVSFYKISGLSRLFPRSRVFGHYHLGHLPEDADAQVEILSGACMFLRKETLDKVGLLDEDFFMYGEDIDLSYRIILGGYDNWYYAGSPIIHYKGESTKKSSVNYVFVFYNAMAIFARKHFAQQGGRLLSLLIRLAIYLSAAGAILKRFVRRAILPVIDLALLFTSLMSSRSFAEHGGHGLPYALLMLAAFWTMGAYDLPLRLVNVLKGAALAGISIAVFMAAASEGPVLDWMQHGFWLALTMAACGMGTRIILRSSGIRAFVPDDHGSRRVLAIGAQRPAEDALHLLWQTHYGLGAQARLDPAELADGPEGSSTVARKVADMKAQELVFCSGDLRWQRIIDLMVSLRRKGLVFKIAQPDTRYLIGPSTNESMGDLLVLPDHAVGSAAARRRKRSLDLALVLLFTVTLPIMLLRVRNTRGFLRNLWLVALGRRTWVGYHGGKDQRTGLPKLPTAPLGPYADVAMPMAPALARRLNLDHARNYRVAADLRAIRHGTKALGNPHP